MKELSGFDCSSLISCPARRVPLQTPVTGSALRTRRAALRCHRYLGWSLAYVQHGVSLMGKRKDAFGVSLGYLLIAGASLGA